MKAVFLAVGGLKFMKFRESVWDPLYFPVPFSEYLYSVSL